MADGDKLNPNLGGDTCYQAQFGETLIGDASPWWITAIDGLGGRAMAGPRVQRDMAPGEIVGTHVPLPGALAITAWCESGDPATMETAIAALVDVWVPSGVVLHAPVRLDLLVPGRGHLWMSGTPVQAAPTRVFAGGGVANVVLTFAKSDPVEHTVEPMPS